MTRHIEFQIVSLPETYVAGLAFRTKNEREQDPAIAWIARTWERVRAMENQNPPAAVLTDYENDKDGYFTEVIGFKRSTANGFEPSEVLAKVPAGQYALFAKTGKLPNIVLEAWEAVWQAEKDDLLERAYTTDLETYSGMDDPKLNTGASEATVKLYIAIKL